MYWYWYYLLYSVFAFGFSEIKGDPSKSNFNRVLSSKGDDDGILEDVRVVSIHIFYE